MVSENIKYLTVYAKKHPYFWNGLFAVLYEEIRDECSVDELTVGYKPMYEIFASSTTIKNYLNCKKEMSYEDFIDCCKGINKNITQMSILQLSPYLNKTLDYLNEQIQTGKMSRSKKYRQKILSQPDIYTDDNFLLQQELKQIEEEKRNIIKIFSDLSEIELALLYRVADGFCNACTCPNGDFFVEHFSKLNQNGKALFCELLETESAKRNLDYDNKIYDFCQKMQKEENTLLPIVSPEILYQKLFDNKYDTPEDAYILKKYRYANTETWKILEKCLRLIDAYLEEEPEDSSFGNGNCLLIFLESLTKIPSLKCKLNE